MITNKWESKDGPRKERKRRRTTTTVDIIWRCFVFGFSTIVMIVMVQLGLQRVQINVVVSSAEPVHVIFKVNQSLAGVQLTRSQYYMHVPPPRPRAVSVISDSAGQLFARGQIEATAKAAPLTARSLIQRDRSHRSQTPRSHWQARSRER